MNPPVRGRAPQGLWLLQGPGTALLPCYMSQRMDARATLLDDPVGLLLTAAVGDWASPTAIDRLQRAATVVLQRLLRMWPMRGGSAAVPSGNSRLSGDRRDVGCR